MSKIVAIDALDNRKRKSILEMTDKIFMDEDRKLINNFVMSADSQLLDNVIDDALNSTSDIAYDIEQVQEKFEELFRDTIYDYDIPVVMVSLVDMVLGECFSAKFEDTELDILRQIKDQWYNMHLSKRLASSIYEIAGQEIEVFNDTESSSDHS